MLGVHGAVHRTRQPWQHGGVGDMVGSYIMYTYIYTTITGVMKGSYRDNGKNMETAT